MLCVFCVQISKEIMATSKRDDVPQSFQKLHFGIIRFLFEAGMYSHRGGIALDMQFCQIGK